MSSPNVHLRTDLLLSCFTFKELQKRIFIMAPLKTTVRIEDLIQRCYGLLKTDDIVVFRRFQSFY